MRDCLWTASETLEFWNLGILVLCNLKPCSFRTKLRTLEPARNLWKAQGQKLNMWSQNKRSLRNAVSAHQHVDSTCKYNGNRLRNDHGLEMLTQPKRKPMQAKCNALQSILHLWEKENLDGLSSDWEAELGKLCNFFQ